MEFRYDPAADALYIRFARVEVVESEEIEEGVIVDYGPDGEIVGVEIVGVKSRGIDLNKLVFEPEKVLPVMV